MTAARCRVFLDADVLFSAAWRDDAGLLRLWRRADARLITSEKDRPILVAAVRGRATHLLTGDVRHFGRLYRRIVGGVLILRPSEFLALPEVHPPPKRAGRP